MYTRLKGVHVPNVPTCSTALKNDTKPAPPLMMIIRNLTLSFRLFSFRRAFGAEHPGERRRSLGGARVQVGRGRGGGGSGGLVPIC